jgi:RHS repeat-associated protein
MKFTYDTTTATPLMLADGKNSYLYGSSDVPYAQIDSAGAVKYLHGDDIGSTRVLTDSRGAVVRTYNYGPHGAMTGAGAATTPFGFAGQYSDAESGLIWMRARYYDPATGQFLTRDPVVSATRTPYLYSDGDPLNRRDPLGLDWTRKFLNWYVEKGQEKAPDWYVKGFNRVTDFSGGFTSKATWGLADPYLVTPDRCSTSWKAGEWSENILPWTRGKGLTKKLESGLRETLIDGYMEEHTKNAHPERTLYNLLAPPPLRK